VTILPGIALYNQARQRDEDFIESFVARHELLELLLNVLRKTARGGESEHQLIVGQRGMGKSSLLRRVALGVKDDEELRTHLMALQFREEQYNVNTLDVFWRNCGEALAQWCEDNDRHEMARRLDVAIENPTWRESATAANAFVDACMEVGKRPVLLVDNLDFIVEALRPDEQWALRRILQSQRGPILVGAATHFLRQSGDRDAAFYEFFHPHVLEPLTETELTHCMCALADRRGEAGEPVRQILDREPERLHALYDLTGGNPRVLALIYQLLERRETGDVFADLEALLDQVSPYYKSRVEEYATPQQRSVIDAIALNWDPITSHGLSLKAGIEITTTSSHLNRMKKDGFIEEVETSGARSGYQLAERFLNIWYLMRHGTRRTRLRLRWLVKFLSKLYSSEELGRMAREARNQAGPRVWHPDFREAVVAAFRESRLSLRAIASQSAAKNYGKILGQSARTAFYDGQRSETTRQSRGVSAIEVSRRRAHELTKRGD
jgi:AAA ATPase domain